MRCSPSHLALPYLAVGTFLHSTIVVCLFACVITGLDFDLTPHSRLAQLNRFPLATINVDPALIQALWDSGWRIVAGMTVVVVQSLLIVALLLERNRKRRATHALAESENRYRNVVESQTELICRYLPDTTLTFVNDAYCRYFDKRRDELIGSQFLNLIPQGSREVALKQVQSLIERPKPELHEHEVIRPDGSVGWHQWVNAVISRNGVVELQGIGRDITDRKALEENLRLSEREFSTIVKNSPDIICRLDRNLRYIYVSPSLEKAVNVKPEFLLGKTSRELNISDWDWKNFEQDCLDAITDKRTVSRSLDYRGKHFRTRIIPEFSANGDVESLMTITEDATERVRAEQELNHLTVRLFNLQDEERRRIARELHDGSAQDLFAISVNLAKLGQLNKESEETQQLVNECQSMCDHSLQEIRTLSYLLHPPLLDQLGLVSALQWYVEGFTKRSGIYVSVYAQQIGRLPGEVEMALFRVVQEALTNVRRHAQSETASIRLEKRSDEVVLEIKDQGKGLVESSSRRDTHGLISIGVGIPGMRQRLSQLGGNLEILSSESGTTIAAVVPVRNGVSHGANTFS